MFFWGPYTGGVWKVLPAAVDGRWRVLHVCNNHVLWWVLRVLLVATNDNIERLTGRYIHDSSSGKYPSTDNAPKMRLHYQESRRECSYQHLYSRVRWDKKLSCDVDGARRELVMGDFERVIIV